MDSSTLHPCNVSVGVGSERKHVFMICLLNPNIPAPCIVPAAGRCVHACDPGDPRSRGCRSSPVRAPAAGRRQSRGPGEPGSSPRTPSPTASGWWRRRRRIGWNRAGNEARVVFTITKNQRSSKPPIGKSLCAGIPISLLAIYLP